MLASAFQMHIFPIPWSPALIVSVNDSVLLVFEENSFDPEH